MTNTITDFMNAVKQSNLSTKEKFNVVHDFLAVTKEERKQELVNYKEQLLAEVNRDIMSQKHPEFATYFKAL